MHGSEKLDWVLLHEFPPHRQVENKLAQARNRVRRITHPIEMGEQQLFAHRSSAAARIALSWSHNPAASPSAMSSFASKSLGSPWSSIIVCGFLKSRI